jgi:hypothetical protein
VDTFYVTFANVDVDNYQIQHKYTPAPPAAPLYTVNTTNYRADSYANITGDASYVGVIDYPALGFEVWQLMTTYEPSSNRVQNQTLQKMGAWFEGSGFKVGDTLDITRSLDLTQFPLQFSVIRAGQPPGHYTQDLWAYVGSANCQLGLEETSSAGNIVHAAPPASLPGIWSAPAAVTFRINNTVDPKTVQLALALSPSGSQVKQIAFYWLGWDWGIAPNDTFFAGPCGIEIRNYSGGILQTFVYNRDFGPDGNLQGKQYIDLTPLFNSQPDIKIVRYSYYGTGTKTVVMDGDSSGNGSFELGEAQLIGAVYPTNAVLQKEAVVGATNQHVCGIHTAGGSNPFVFFVQNVSTQPRYN